ncbi:hypothetical protein CC78DRAFT_576818 [Lojkania enalia]|uniref:Uncharacterized protein n=1 Tax=Lojkania enalia TaxID=147567 RepID=A0A9P4N619_9PLEO|nr:hypothetical protein CC78DRAFT_576818 [Didymosphaeria enalia]
MADGEQLVLLFLFMASLAAAQIGPDKLKLALTQERDETGDDCDDVRYRTGRRPLCAGSCLPTLEDGLDAPVIRSQRLIRSAAIRAQSQYQSGKHNRGSAMSTPKMGLSKRLLCACARGPRPTPPEAPTRSNHDESRQISSSCPFRTLPLQRAGNSLASSTVHRTHACECRLIRQATAPNTLSSSHLLTFCRGVAARRWPGIPHLAIRPRPNKCRSTSPVFHHASHRHSLAFEAGRREIPRNTARHSPSQS